MAEGVLFNVAGGIIERLGCGAFQEIGLIWGVQDEFQNLKETVAGFQAVLLDAEQKQANNEVKLWLQSVEDAVYEADEVLDEFNTEAQRRQMVPENTKLSKKVRLFFSSSNQFDFGLKMGHKVKNINKRLNEVASRRPNDLRDNREDTRFTMRERVAHSFVPKENIIGRDEDKKAVIQLLLDPISTENVSTISIVGFGGLGKTAIAQLIFNDEEIQNHFELKIWICVSNVFELDILAKKILKQLDKHHLEMVDKLDMDQLQNNLREKVDGKKYLLVLDDVWNEDLEKWLSLKCLLMGGGKGSRILITTRSETVATTSDTDESYTLRGLNEKQSWSLFKKMAFKDGKEPQNPTIKAVGEEVARKCLGVPLAIRTIGGMLRTRHNETEWLNFKEKKLSKISQKENDILPTLKLSYDVLPSHLKHCFAYCSLFPPDYDISVPILIRLWVAQGFIKSSDENECLEDVAYEYYNELLCISFFQEEEKDEFGIIKSCKMHDLMIELAILVSGVRSVVVDLNRKNFDEKLRHVSFNFDIDLSKWEVSSSLLKANKIRTFLFVQENWFSGQSSSRNAFYTTFFSNFKSLRVLSLTRLRIKRVPNCLKKMKHLRYLDLSWNLMKRLPDWMVGLSNLETLDLTWCQWLVELPRDIKKMINLRHLILEGCGDLTGMPRGIGELKGVRTLNRFVLSESNCLRRGGSAGLAELGTLNELRGVLVIFKLRHVVSESNVGTPLKDKQHLHSLHLWWKEGEDVKGVDEEDIIKSMDVLQPHSNLKHLSVILYGGVRFASWLSSLINIVNLAFWNCRRCQHLPPLDLLPSLKSLYLGGLEKLEYILLSEKESSNSMSDEMMRISFFPSLETLKVYNCPVLKGWWRAHTHNTASSSSSSTEILSLPSFPSLSALTIWNCPNLTSMPLYPNVVEIELAMSSWKVVDSLFVRGASDITHDVGVDVSASSSSPHLSKLTRLELTGIEDLASLPEEISNLTSLQLINIVELPRDVKKMINLRHLILEGCDWLRGMPRGIGELNGVRTLNRFVLSESNCSGRGGSAGLGELGSLKELRGDLFINKLRHVVSESNVGTPLKDKQHLYSLGLAWKEGEDVSAVDEEDIIKSMEVLQPHSNLKQLTVYFYSGVRFASWFSSLINIVRLTFNWCERCQHLPPLDHLTSLKFLSLRGLEKLEYILLSEKESSNSMSDEMMRISFFPSLEELRIQYCPVLKGWWRAHTHNSASSSSSTENLSLPSFPSLSTLRIWDCPNLTSIPLYPNVERIDLKRSSWKVVDSLFVRGASDIPHDVGVDVSASSSSPHLSKLTFMWLRGIEDLASLPEGIRGLPCLNKLNISECPMLSERCKKETGDDWHKIAHIPHIDIH